MIGEKNYLNEIQSYSNSYVTFEDGAKCKIIGKGKLNYPCLISLDNELLVESLTINLSIISQICYQDLSVNFNCSKCTITDKYQVHERI